MDAHGTILVIGGTGHFGARICRRLANQSGLKLIVTSRNQTRARSLIDHIARAGARARLSSAALDQNSADFFDVLKQLAPDVVIHTAGPYQGQAYTVAQASINAGCHCIDMADGREFVAGIGQLDDSARTAGVTVVSGASTLPALPAAVIDEVRSDFASIDSVETCIAPAHQTPRGLGTIRAVLSYCGKPFDTLRDGRPKRVYGWQDLRFVRIPGLGLRLAAACDVPDFDLLPRYIGDLRSLRFHAALEAPWEHLALWMMALLTRSGLIDDWTRLAESFASVSRRLEFLGSDTGGMRVRIAGVGMTGTSMTKEWTLTATHNHGPEIPCTPAIVLAKKLLGDNSIPAGARPCLGLFSIDELMREMRDFKVTSLLKSSES